LCVQAASSLAPGSAGELAACTITSEGRAGTGESHLQN
jgi:hypothetical protein